MTPTPIGERMHPITLQNPGPPAANPDDPGTFLQTWTDLAPALVWAKIVPATARDLERTTAGTVVSTASHLVTIPYHPQVTTETRVLFNGRSFSVTGVANPEERNIELILACVEQLGTAPLVDTSWLQAGWMQ